MHYFLKHYREQLKAAAPIVRLPRPVADQKKFIVLPDISDWVIQPGWPTIGADTISSSTQEGVQL
jgi:hypothetical protein